MTAREEHEKSMDIDGYHHTHKRQLSDFDDKTNHQPYRKQCLHGTGVAADAVGRSYKGQRTTVSTIFNKDPPRTLTLKESWDMEKLGQLINCAVKDECTFDANKLCQMKRIYGQLSASGELEVTYEPSEWITEAGHNFGRRYGNGYQSVPGAVRRICGEAFYYDLDMVNCHFELLLGLCERFGIESPLLKHYVENRDECLRKTSPDRKKAKESYLCVLFLSDVDEENPLYALRNEFGKITDTFWGMERYNKIRNACSLHVNKYNQDHPDGKHKNEKATFLSHILGTLECKITFENIQYLKRNGIGVGANCHDGMMVEKKEIKNLDHLLRDLEKHTLCIFKLKVHYVEKSMQPSEEDLMNLWHPFNDYRQKNLYTYHRVFHILQQFTKSLNTDAEHADLDYNQRLSKLTRRTCELMNMVFARVEGVKPTVYEREASDNRIVRFKERSLFDFKQVHNESLHLLDRSDPSNGKKKTHQTLSIAKLWLDSCLCLCYKRVVFNSTPHNEADTATPDELNLFQGLKVVPTYKYNDSEMKGEVWKDAIGSFIEHVHDNLCRGDDELFQYVIHWLAMTVIRPWKKIRASVVMQAQEGTGKGTLVNIIKSCVGEDYVTAPPTLEEALEGFNACYVDTCLLMFLDEAFFGGSKKINGQLKKLVTEPEVPSREKFRENRMIRNAFNIVQASNEEHVLQSKLNTRRFVTLECSNEMAGGSGDTKKQQYFERLRSTDTQVLVNYFNSLDLDNWNPDNIPATSGDSKQKEHSLEQDGQFVLDFLNDPSIIDHAKRTVRGVDSVVDEDCLQGYYCRKSLFEIFKERYSSGRFGMNQAKLTRRIVCLTGGDNANDTKVGTARLIWMPSLEEARRSFRTQTGITHDVFG